MSLAASPPPSPPPPPPPPCVQLKDDPNIVIAKCDATANDVPGLYEVRG